MTLGDIVLGILGLAALGLVVGVVLIRELCRVVSDMARTSGSDDE